MRPIAKSLGKQSAHQLVYEVTLQAQSEVLHLKQALINNRQISAILDNDEIEAVFDLEQSTGVCANMVDQVITQIDEVSYSACGLPYVISGVIEDGRKIVIRQPEDFAKEGIKVFTRHRVTNIDKARQQLTVRNLTTNADEVVDYDRLILATGARPIVSNIEGINLEGVLTLRNISELGRFKKLLNTMQPKKAVIIGAGYIGLELAESFHELNIKTTIVEKAVRILPKFDPEMAQPVHDHLLENHVELILGDDLAELHGENVTGGNAHFPGVFGTAIFKTFKLTVAITGIEVIRCYGLTG